MPTFRTSEDGEGPRVEARRQGRTVVFQLSPEGRRFLTDVLRLADGGELSADDLDFLIDRGWANEEEIVIAPVPKAAPIADPPPQPPHPIETRPESSRSVTAAMERHSDLQKALVARRSRAREVALQVLYQHEQNPGYPSDQIERFIRRRLTDPVLRDYAHELINGSQKHRDRIDELISKVAENWRIDRMAAIDRNILRLGAYELLHAKDVPTKVAINEALELAKRYSTAQSSRFVNGILDRLLEADAQPTPVEPEPTPIEPLETGSDGPTSPLEAPLP